MTAAAAEPPAKPTAKPKAASKRTRRPRVVNRQRAAKPGSTTGTPKRVMIAVADRRAKAIDLYLSGVDPIAIGRTLSRQKGTPYGYDEEAADHSLGATVSKDITRAMEDRARDSDTDVRLLRRELTATHRRILAALMQRVLSADPAAAAAAATHLTRIARLNGVDEPTRVAVTSSDPAVRAAVDEIMRLTGVSADTEPPDAAP